MGLDQYAYVRKNNNETESVGSAKFVWRKHAKLQQFMEDLWYSKNKEEFNCKDLELTEDMVKYLKLLITHNKMEESEGGFFYGHQFQDEQEDHYKEQDLEFCDWAIKTIRDGKTVCYSCWY